MQRVVNDMLSVSKVSRLCLRARHENQHIITPDMQNRQ